MYSVENSENRYHTGGLQPELISELKKWLSTELDLIEKYRVINRYFNIYSSSHRKHKNGKTTILKGLNLQCTHKV